MQVIPVASLSFPAPTLDGPQSDISSRGQRHSLFNADLPCVSKDERIAMAVAECSQDSSSSTVA